MTSRSAALPDYGWNAGTNSHCQRVAAWSGELGSALGLSESERKLVEQAAISHHIPEILLSENGRQRLLADLRVTEHGDQPPIPEDVRQILQAFRARNPAAGAPLSKLVALLEISDDFDQFFEGEPLRDSDLVADSSVETMMSYLQVTSRADVGRVIDRLPVFPTAAREIIKHTSNPDSGVRELEHAASMDQVLAGLLIQTANSPHYSPHRPIAALSDSISSIGLETARKVLLAAALRTSFATLRHRQLWNHSVDVAQAAEDLARYSKLQPDPSEAFLAGLVHDIGCLAFSMMPANFLDRFYRLTTRGCPQVEVEMCLAGLCHGDVGAETLSQWKFPVPVIEAVRWHHRPERSPGCLASLLYLGEFWSDSDEDLPSCVRFRAALARAGIEEQTLAQIGRKEKGYLESLRFAA